MSHQLPAGTILHHRYRIDAVIGQGGFGITYKAFDPGLNQVVCIKELFPSGLCVRGPENTVVFQGKNAHEFPAFRNRFIKEARELARFRHPNIVRVSEVFEANQTAYFVMDFVEGETLRELVTREGRLNQERALPLMQGLLDAVEEVHRAGLLHRDIKPDNVLIEPGGKVVLIDFGSAKEFEDGKTLSQTAILTPGYAPLEQYSDTAQRGTYTDIYALGATFYFLLTGKKPLAAIDRQDTALAAPHSLFADVSEVLSSAIMLALNLRPVDRFQTVGELRNALKGIDFTHHILSRGDEIIVRLRQLLERPPTDETRTVYITSLENLLNESGNIEGASWKELRASIKSELHKEWQNYGYYWQNKNLLDNAQKAFEKGLIYHPECSVCSGELERYIPPKTRKEEPSRLTFYYILFFLIFSVILIYRIAKLNFETDSNVGDSLLTITTRSDTFTNAVQSRSGDGVGSAQNQNQNLPTKRIRDTNLVPVTAEHNSETEIKYNLTQAEIISKLKANMVFIQGGTFTMGCTSEQGSDCQGDESPAHQVTVSSFRMGKYEVTQAEWEAVMGSNPSNFQNCPDCPVEYVNWNDVQDFIRKLNNASGGNYRLPTEAEWEFAARGGNRSSGTKYSGSYNISGAGWYDGNSGSRTHRVGQKQANELGLYDMSGNVWEWCSDWYGENFYSNGLGNNPRGPSAGSYRVLRGGSWFRRAWICRVSYRGTSAPDYRNSGNGFRLVSLGQ